MNTVISEGINPANQPIIKVSVSWLTVDSDIDLVYFTSLGSPLDLLLNVGPTESFDKKFAEKVQLRKNNRRSISANKKTYCKKFIQ